MGFAVLESLFYDLPVWCFEFLHLKCRKIVNRVCRAAVFLESGFWNLGFLGNDLGSFEKVFGNKFSYGMSIL